MSTSGVASSIELWVSGAEFYALIHLELISLFTRVPTRLLPCPLRSSASCGLACPLATDDAPRRWRKDLATPPGVRRCQYQRLRPSGQANRG